MVVRSKEYFVLKAFAVNFIVIVALAIGFVGCGGGVNANSFTDSRDGKTYRIVRIGNQTWMGENLNFVIDDSVRSWCYDNDPANCEKYGRLYTWDAARNACPAGWRLPTRQDWNDLVQAAGGNVAGTKLKASAPDWDGTDDFGFSALPGGGRIPNGRFDTVGSYGLWWSATENDGGYAFNRGMYSGDAVVYEDWYDKGYGFSVRCVLYD